MHALLLAVVVVQGRIREANALIHKPKVLKTTGPSSALAKAWNARNQKTPFPRSHRRMPGPSQYTTRQQERSKNSMEMKMAQGNIGMEKYPGRNILSSSRAAQSLLVAASALTVLSLFNAKGVLALLSYPSWIVSSVLYKPYQNLLVTNPLPTKVLTGAILSLLGDAIAQATANTAAVANNQEKAAYDKRRAISFAAFDACYRCFQHIMFPIIIRVGKGNVVKSLLTRFLPSQRLVTMLAPAAAAIEQTAMYQMIIVPLIYYPVFFSFTGIIQGLTVKESLQRMQQNFLTCWGRNLMFWIPTQMVLFGLVAENWQIPFACLMGMIWSMILSKIAGSTDRKSVV